MLQQLHFKTDVKLREIQIRPHHYSRGLPQVVLYMLENLGSLHGEIVLVGPLDNIITVVEQN